MKISLRRSSLNILIFIILLPACGLSAPEAGHQQPAKEDGSGSIIGFSCIPITNDGAISISTQSPRTRQAKVRTCLLDNPVVICERSSDGKSLIVSETRYISFTETSSCSGESVIRTKQVPEDVGFLVDISEKHNLYLTLDVISTSPALFLATVATIGSTDNLVDLPGSYNEAKSLNDLQSEGFAHTPGGDQPRISRNGKYVAASGVISCNEDSYPGVWDILQNRRVVIENDPEGELCRNLFS